MTTKKVLIMAGGTGGHIFPALAVAKAMQEQGIDIHWLGTQRGLENEIVPKANIPLSHISVNGLRGKGLTKWITAPFALLPALLQARKIIKEINPDVVLGMGGFASGPGGIAAWLLRKPLVIHEQNAIPGFTNRTLAWFAKCTLAAFPGTFAKTHRHIVVTGNPVRAEIINLPDPEQRMRERTGPLHLLVLGGSQGAEIINKTLPNTLAILNPEERPEVWHQTGKNDLEKTRRAYQLIGLKAKLDSFIEDMAQALAWADLVVCRAGALTVSELAAAGIGSILIPYPYSIDNHQLHNAEYLAHPKGAIILLQGELTSARLAESLRKILRNRESLLRMATIARGLCQADATQKVIENCIAVMKTKNVSAPQIMKEPEAKIQLKKDEKVG